MKESDRLCAVAAMLRAFGARVEELPDELVIKGGALSGGAVDCCGDHRIAMAAAVAATIAQGETMLTGAECWEKITNPFVL
jgi:3-phosphoshikimate 1-carboxyvinyltransferase